MPDLYELGAGTKMSIDKKDGKVFISIEIDEKKIAKAEVPALLAAMAAMASGEKAAPAAPKRGRPKKGVEGGPSGHDNPAVPPLPFKEPEMAGAAK